MTPLKVRVSVSSDPAVGLPAMVGYSIAGHFVAFVILILAPRVMPHTPPPPLILAGQIVSLPPPLGTPSAPPAESPAAAQKPPERNPEEPNPPEPKHEAPPPPPAKPAPPAKEEAPKPPPKKKAADVVPPEPGKEKAPKEEPVKGKGTAARTEPEAAKPEPGKPETPAAKIPEGVGLAVSGEPGGIPSINSAAFPYDWYRAAIVNKIRSQWRRPVTPGLTQPLRCSISFVISRAGALSDVTVAASSGFSTLDLSAVRAVTDSSPLPQLPYQYTADSIRGELVFELTPD